MPSSRTPACLAHRWALRPDVGEAPRQEIAEGGSPGAAACHRELASRGIVTMVEFAGEQ